jgi:alpha-amylase
MNRGVMFQYFEWNCRSDGSLWRELAGRARELKNLGTTAVWFPPAYKGMHGGTDVGYATYDLYDLGEFDQKGSVRTKYGTREEFLAAVKAVQEAGMHAYADAVLNHKMGADEVEEVEVEEICCDNRNCVDSQPYKIRTWSHFKFPGRAEQYSSFKWHWQHFNAFGSNADVEGGPQKIYRVVGKTFSGEVCFEYGNFDYLMGADVDTYHEEVRADLFRWGEWFVETTGVDGFRLDAVKHIPASFYKDWFAHLKERFGGREVFGVGEYWSGNLDELNGYIDATGGAIRLFDVPLHFNLMNASKQGRDYDLTKVFDGTLVQHNPLMAVTFVDNHDSQPGQSLESWVDDWFKPLAYALILLRKDGYPCLFYGDYFGNAGDENGNNKLVSHRKLIDDFLQARAKFTHGDQHDYFDHPTCVGWLWSGNEEHPGALAVVMSTGDAGSKRMQTFHPNQTFRDLTGHWPEPVTADESGEAEFRCPAGKVSVWCMC